MAGYLHSLLGMFGLGDTYNPLSKYEEALTAAKDKMNDTVAQGTLKVLIDVDKTINQLNVLLGVYADYQAFETNFTRNLASFASGGNQTQIAILAVLVLIIIVYLFIAPK